MPTKKYKLHSMSADSDQPRVCAFFLSEKGCRNGANCKFAHTTKTLSMAPASNKDNSAVSSESEDEAKDEEACQTISNTYASLAEKKTEVNIPLAEKKTEVKRSPFAKPKRKAVVVPEDTPPEPAKRKKKNGADTKGTPTPPLSSKASDLLNKLNLPVAAYPGHEAGKARKAPAQKAKKAPTVIPPIPAEVKKQELLPVPTSEEGQKWNDCIRTVRSDHRYAKKFDFSSFRKRDAEAGYGSKTWVKTPSENTASKASHAKVIAIDCEMCETTDPVSGEKDMNALCRVSVVDGTTKEVLLDSLVKPAMPVTNYRTWINGITAEHLEKVNFSLRHAQAFCMALCTPETVVVGHAVHHDLAALRWEHPTAVDSSLLFESVDHGKTVSLKDLAKSVLDVEMPETHDSVNDALVALRCCEFYRDRNGEVNPIPRTIKENKHGSGYDAKLLVHRIPQNITEADLSTMIQEHTHVVPIDVAPIVLNSNTQGKAFVTFASPAHAALAFETIKSSVDVDASGKLQKKVFMKNGGYVRVRSHTSQSDNNK